MPRSRLLLLVGSIAALLAGGLWIHSLFRSSQISVLMPGGGHTASIGLVAGSVEVTWGTFYGHGRKPVDYSSVPLRFRSGGDPSIPGGYPDYRMGRFHHHRQVFRPAPREHTRTTTEVPIWFLLLLGLLLLAPIEHRARKGAQSAPLVPSPKKQKGG